MKLKSTDYFFIAMLAFLHQVGVAHSPEPSQAENTDSTTELKQKVASGPSDNDDRLRMFGGVVDVSLESPNAIIIPFFNVNYRWSPVKPPGTKYVARFGYGGLHMLTDFFLYRIWWNIRGSVCRGFLGRKRWLHLEDF